MTNGPAPPNTEEVDVGTGGTKIGGSSVTAESNITTISSMAIGTINVVRGVAQFNVVKKVGITNTTVKGISSISIPFGSNTLVVDDHNGSARWRLDGTVLTGDSGSKWRSDMITPSETSTNNQVSYTKGTDTTNINFSEFVQMQITIDQ